MCGYGKMGAMIFIWQQFRSLLEVDHFEKQLGRLVLCHMV
jgi:hypothetical protein